MKCIFLLYVNYIYLITAKTLYYSYIYQPNKTSMKSKTKVINEKKKINGRCTIFLCATQSLPWLTNDSIRIAFNAQEWPLNNGTNSINLYTLRVRPRWPLPTHPPYLFLLTSVPKLYCGFDKDWAGHAFTGPIPSVPQYVLVEHFVCLFFQQHIQ